MKLTAFFAMFAFCFQVHASGLKSPKTIVFTPKTGSQITVKFNGALPLSEKPPGPDHSQFKTTDDCDIVYYSSMDHNTRANSHRFMGTDVLVNMDGKDYFITPAFGAGMETPFESHWWYCTTEVFENSHDCHQRINPLRILIGIYANDHATYTNREDYKIGWERDTDQAYLLKGDGEFDLVAKGKVIDWY